MAKSQKRSNKEIRKPKQEKQAKPAAAASMASSSPVKVIEGAGFPGKKKK